MVNIKKWAMLPLGIFVVLGCLSAQPYTQAQFAVAVQKNIPYGSAINYAGQEEVLKMDIYKPLGNMDAARPIYIHAHGGSWLEISNKEQPEGAAVCAEMAKRGYVAANIEYRRGFHRLPFYNPYALCSTVALPNMTDCIYVQDTNEVIRAIYRGMQDAKGAIRFMKGRHLQDSTDTEKVAIGGESAGGFIAMYAGFLTCPSEKPVGCYALPNALPADADLADCSPTNISLSRPDLGSIEGTLHLNNGFDASVKGVANFFGGVMHNLIAGPKPPALFLFHQTNDVVVDCGYKMPMLSIYEQVIIPLNLCQPLTTIPQAWGSCAIRDYLQTLGAAAPIFNAQIVGNGPPNVFADPPGHAYDNIALRSGQATAFFSPYLVGTLPLPAGNDCLVNSTHLAEVERLLSVFPNPFKGSFECRLSSPAATEASLSIFSMTGQMVFSETIPLQAGENVLPITCRLTPGVYCVRVATRQRVWSAWIVGE